MIVALDSSILVASLAEHEKYHVQCENLLFDHECHIYTHALAEAFSTLTGSRLGYRLPASDAISLLKESIRPRLKITALTEDDLFSSMQQAEARGIRGGAIYDYLHLVAARKAGAGRLYTLNIGDFTAFHRPGDPEISHP